MSRPIFLAVAAMLLEIWAVGTAPLGLETTTEGTVVFDEAINWDDTAHISAGAKIHFPKWVDTWVAPSQIRKWFPWYHAGYDNDGCPVYVIEYGNWKYAEAVAHDGGKLREMVWKYFEQGVYRLLRHGMEKNEQGVFLLFDYNGFSMANFLNVRAIELAIKEMAMLDKICNVVNQAFFINTNFAAENFIRLAKPFIGKLQERSEVYGTKKEKWLPVITKQIPSDQLPMWYGGEKAWKPVWLGGMPLGNATHTAT